MTAPGLWGWSLQRAEGGWSFTHGFMSTRERVERSRVLHGSVPGMFLTVWLHSDWIFGPKMMLFSYYWREHSFSPFTC